MILKAECKDSPAQNSLWGFIFLETTMYVS